MSQKMPLSDVEDDTFSARTVEVKLNQIEDQTEIIEDTENNDKSAAPRHLRFRDKEFILRPSLLTERFERGPAGIIYNFFFALLLLSTIATLFKDFYEHGNPLYHFWLIVWNFEQLPITLTAWLAMFLSTILFTYYGMRFWSRIGCAKLTLFNQSPFLFAYIGYIIALFYYSLKFVFMWKLNCACSFIITCENTRFAMKVHSFVRENFCKGRRKKMNVANNRGEQKTPIDAEYDMPTLEQFIYFMFCPAFLYRDTYPRSTTREWRVVGKHLVHCLCSIYLTNLAFIHLVRPNFEQMTYEEGVPWQQLVYSIFPSIVPGAICMVALFFGLLHSWLNMFSEAMLFGDRRFYANWWNSRNMAEYYRNWNLVVHDWLYTYVYRDIALLIGSRNGLNVAQIMVFFFSAAFHEYWFGVSLRLFYPVMFTLYFVLGGIFFFVSRLIREPYIWNIAMWFNLLIGTGMFFAAYAPEWSGEGRTYYDVLGIKLHPDTCGSSESFLELKKAYDVLRRPFDRALYDKQLISQHSRTSRYEQYSASRMHSQMHERNTYGYSQQHHHDFYGENWEKYWYRHYGNSGQTSTFQEEKRRKELLQRWNKVIAIIFCFLMSYHFLSLYIIRKKRQYINSLVASDEIAKSYLRQPGYKDKAFDEDEVKHIGKILRKNIDEAKHQRKEVLDTASGINTDVWMDTVTEPVDFNSLPKIAEKHHYFDKAIPRTPWPSSHS
ncbi:MBOAT, membrane-bound o-acyltransferase family domain-containing protein [Ditylenchus destructor]|uniref:MBOAT, membrane-bound o-acyltransferase family domain-containing protein n=1 Tax=Ditylenchus destructor TaxID=166010 RepID=A0AAD4NK30_9BILA|nr:MBOAT, membrane-bound o-acyltransferase family domain-containing protein [Ditylenchus destructor]